ncbi:peptidoglycan-binding protein [Sorangium sp. So ce385]|uniref:peptidoglycan-binding domain-containing protein n=1 Tax=Sorangium sp. So ce385 TaxID=3133308 RepID=UPI003F5C4CDC
MRIVQMGSGEPRDLVLCYLVGPHMDAALRDALGPAPCVVAYATGKTADNLDAVTAAVRDRLHLPTFGRIVLAGYSLGCSGVRSRLLERAQANSAVAALVLVDGTHASKPPVAWQIDVWRDTFARARRGELLVVATHTQQSYVEQLRSPETPFLSTATVLRQATEWPLDAAGPVDAPAVRNDGQLWIYSYASKAIDAEAHILQQREVLPRVLRQHIRPWLEGAGADPTRPADPPVGADALEQAEHASASGQPGPSPVVRQILRLGARGEDVAAWQRVIGAEPDGVFGGVTERLTRQWQKRHGLGADGIVGPLTWSAAEARSGEGLPPREVPKQATPLSEAELSAVLEHSHELVFHENPSRARLACAWAHVAIENGRGQKVWNYNLGNITGFGQWPGQYYVIRVAERVQRNPDVWKQVDMRFRAHAEALDGAADYWRLMGKHYQPALARFDAGDAAGAAFELSRLRYYTAHADTYARNMSSLYRSFPG